MAKECTRSCETLKDWIENPGEFHSGPGGYEKNGERIAVTEQTCAGPRLVVDERKANVSYEINPDGSLLLPAGSFVLVECQMYDGMVF